MLKIPIRTAAALALAGAAGCGSSHHSGATSGGPTSRSTTTATSAPAAAESNPPGDIPDNIAYVPYSNTAGGYRFVHPEGWASTAHGSGVTFTDKLNGIAATPAGPSTPTLASARSHDIPGLKSHEPAFELRRVRAVSLPGGSGVLIVYRRNSTPDQVTGKVYRDEVQRYEIAGHGRGVVLELFGAVGSDNVDPYTKISQSLRLS